MKKLFSRISILVTGLALSLGMGIAAMHGINSGFKSARAAVYTSTLTFTAQCGGSGTADDDKAWTVTSDGSESNFDTGKGIHYGTNSASVQYIKLTSSAFSGATIKQVSVYASAASSVSATVGVKVAGSQFGDDPKALTTSNAEYTFSGSAAAGNVEVTVTKPSKATKAIYCKSVAVTYEVVGSDPLITLDKEDLTVGVGKDNTFTVATENLTENFAISGGNDSYFTLNYTAASADGDHVVTVHGVAATESPIELTVSSTGATSKTISISVIVDHTFEKVTSVASLKNGSEIIIGKADGTYVMGKYSTGNNCPSLANVPDESGNLVESSLPANYALLTLGTAANSKWTLTDQTGKVYYGTSGQNHLKSADSSSDTWSISITEEGVATITSSASSRTIKRNDGSDIFATYSSGQQDVAIYMVPSTEPEIQVAITGSTSLAVNASATLNATVYNTTGTVSWTLAENTPTGTGDVVELTPNGNEVTVTGKKDGTVKVRASLAGCDDVDTLFTVTKELVSIAVTTAPSKTTYTEGETFSTTGMVVTATFDDGSTSTPSDYTYTPNGALGPSDTTITISYSYGGGEAKTTTQAITVNAKVVDSIAVKTMPTKAEYHSGDTFDPTGLVITVTYEDSSSADFTEGFTIEPSAYVFTDADLTAGKKTFTVSYGEKSVTFDINVVDLVRYEAFTGALVEGDYLIAYDGGIMNSTVTSDRIQYDDAVTDEDDIVDPSADTIWHIAKSGDYWTIYNNETEEYAASTGAKNKTQMLESGTDDKSLWSCESTDESTTYDFVNKQNTANEVNAILRRNGTYGFACYADTTGGALSLYKLKGATPTPPTPPVVTFDGLTLSGTYPTEFQQGATFSHDGMVVTANYTGQDDADVTAQAEWSSPDMSTVGQKEVTVSYTDPTYGTQSETYNITVTANPQVLQSISVSGARTSFVQGQAFEFGGTVTGHYNWGDDADVTAQATFDGYDMSVEGEQTVTVHVNEITTTYKINVVSSSFDYTNLFNFAKTFLKKTNTACANDESARLAALQGVWAELKEYSLSAAELAIINDVEADYTTAVPNNAEIDALEFNQTNLDMLAELACARYDWLCKKYGTQLGAEYNFLNRESAQASNFYMFNRNGINNNVLLITLISSITVIAAFGACMMLLKKKRKHN